MMEKPVTVLIADDHPLFLSGVRGAVERVPSLEVVAEAGDGEVAIAFIESLKPDLAILDIRMPKLSGLRVAREIKRRQLSTDVILLTMYDDEETFNEALDLGVMGYISKETAIDDVAAAIRSVVQGHRYISPSMMDLALNRRAGKSSRTKNLPMHTLSPAELRVLGLIAESMTSKEIADTLCISPRTVENHRAHISAKLDIHGSYSLLKFALENRANLLLSKTTHED
jgi:DNA-binding NarL/FixJ family response regulator